MLFDILFDMVGVLVGVMVLLFVILFDMVRVMVMVMVQKCLYKGFTCCGALPQPPLLRGGRLLPAVLDCNGTIIRLNSPYPWVPKK